MLVCPKCQKAFDDGSKICRDCGAILDPVEETASDAKDETDGKMVPDRVVSIESPLATGEIRTEPTEEGPQEVWDSVRDSEANAGPWQCLKCQETIESNFDICWNCGTNRLGVEDPGFTSEFEGTESTGEYDIDDSELPAETPPPRRTRDSCERCGTTNVIPNGIIGDQGHSSDGRLKVHVMGNPGALIFKNLMRSELHAKICGECGHVELFISNPRDLYDHYLKAVDEFPNA